jgi:Zinc finger, C3HC4 type (RING finger)
MEMDFDCAVCKCSMDVKPFDEDAEEGIAKDCYRLPCKHAFHASCIIQSLRISGKNCPVCRNGSPEASPPIISIFAMADETDDDEEIEMTEAAMVTERLLHHLHSSHVAIRARKQNLNLAVKQFNIFRDKLRQERKMHLKQAMKEFRRKRFKDLLVKKQQVKSALDQYHASIKEEVGEDVFELMTVDELLKQPTQGFQSVRHQDPLRSSFWHG